MARVFKEAEKGNVMADFVSTPELFSEPASNTAKEDLTMIVKVCAQPALDEGKRKIDPPAALHISGVRKPKGKKNRTVPILNGCTTDLSGQGRMFKPLLSGV